MKSTFKSHGKTYDVKQTSTSIKQVKGHTDFNGYNIPEHSVNVSNHGIFDGDSQVGHVRGDRSVVIDGEKVGKI